MRLGLVGGNMSEVVAKETRNILESIAKILMDQKGNIPNLPEGDQLLIRLSRSAISKMLNVGNWDDEKYLMELADAFQESFIEHKDKWVDALAMNQAKVMSALSGGMVLE